MRSGPATRIVTLSLAALAACSAKQGGLGTGGSGGGAVAGSGDLAGGGGTSGSGGLSGSGAISGNGGLSQAGGRAGQDGAAGGTRSDGGAGTGGLTGATGGVTQTGAAGTGASGVAGGNGGAGNAGNAGNSGGSGSGGTAGAAGGSAGTSPDGAAACVGPTGEPRYSGNPFVKRFVADPAAHVFNGRVYVYDTDDQTNDGTYWNSTVWHAFSSANLVDWKDEGTVLSVKAFSWAIGWSAWAPDVVFKNGKYYFFGPIDDVRIGVAVGNTPTGPFTDAIGSPLIDKTRDANAGDEPIDPAVLIDDDGQAYLYFGTRVPKAVKLTADLVHLDGEILNLSVSGNNYGEAPWMGKHNGVYVFSYSTGWPGQIAYATASNPLGPFTFKGIVLDFVGIQTNHESIVENFKGKSYIFYHNGKLPGGGEFRRSIDVDELHYDASGAIIQVVQTTNGVACVP